MSKKFIILSFIILFLILGGILTSFRGKSTLDSNLKINQNNKPINQQNVFVLYYGEGCPHCKIVEDFIKENNILSKVKIDQKEVYYNKNNAFELLEKARICGINQNSVGVPFLWTGQDCIVGDKPIIDFLNNKITEN